MNTYRLITSCYGHNYLPFLLVFLTSSEGKTVSVFWSDIGVKEITLLKSTFPNVEFIECNLEFGTDSLIRISSKTKLLKEAVRFYPNENLCLIDNDTLILKDIKTFFEKDFDIAFTYDYFIPKINTGVILVKTRPGIEKFFDRWEKETFDIFNDPIRFSQANDRNFPHYGGTDQMSFYHLIEFKEGKKEYFIDIESKTFHILGISCKYLNEINSVPITQDTHIIHYKGRHWRKIILEGGRFTLYRNKKQSSKMLSLFFKTYYKALKKMGTIPKSFLISVPPYIDDRGEYNNLRYWLYVLLT